MRACDSYAGIVLALGLGLVLGVLIAVVALCTVCCVQYWSVGYTAFLFRIIFESYPKVLKSHLKIFRSVSYSLGMFTPSVCACVCASVNRGVGNRNRWT